MLGRCPPITRPGAFGAESKGSERDAATSGFTPPPKNRSPRLDRAIAHQEIPQEISSPCNRRRYGGERADETGLQVSLPGKKLQARPRHFLPAMQRRSEARRVGKECGRTSRS